MISDRSLRVLGVILALGLSFTLAGQSAVAQTYTWDGKTAQYSSANWLPGNVVWSGTGTALINNGTVQVNDSNWTASNIYVASGAQLDLGPAGGNLNLTVAGNIFLSGTSTNGAIYSDNDAGGNINHLTGTLTLNANSNITNWWNDKTLAIDGKITGVGGLILQYYPGNGGTGGSFILSNTTNDYQGGTTIIGAAGGGQYGYTNQSLVFLGANNSLPTTGPLTLNYSNLALNGFSQELSSINGTGSFGVYNGSSTGGSATATLSTLTLGAGNVSSVFNGTLVDNGFMINMSNQAISNSGTLAFGKEGSGSLTLTNTNGYSGATTVTGGALILAGTAEINSTSGITVNGPGAKFVQNSSTALTQPILITQGGVDGTTTVGNVTVAAGAGNSVSAGNGSSGTLTIGNLTFNGAATINVPLGSQLAVGTLTPSGSAKVSINSSNSTWTSGQSYQLIGYSSYAPTGGNVSNDFTVGTIGGLGARQTAALSNPTGAIDLTIGGFAAYWSGGVSGSWQVGGPQNWTQGSGGPGTTYVQGDATVFDDSATGTTAISISGSNVSPASVTFNNSGLSYSISGPNGIAGPAIVAISGGGSVTISNSNGYSGGTVLSLGQLNLGNAAALGSGPLTILGPPSGSGPSIDNTTPGALTLNNAETWSGNFNFVGSHPLNLGGAVTVNGATQVAVNASTLTVSGPIGGTAPVTKTGSGTLLLTGSSTFSGGLTLQSGLLVLNSNNALGAGVLTINGGTIDSTVAGITLANNGQNWASDFTFKGTQGLNTGAGAVQLDSVINLTVSANTLTVAGAINGAGGLTLDGPGTLLLLNPSYSGATTVNAGTLVLQNAANFRAPGGIVDNTLVIAQADSGGLQSGAGMQLDLTGTLTGTGVFNKTGTGSLWIGAYTGTPLASSFTIAMSPGAQINVMGGIMRNEGSSGSWVGNQASLFVASGGTVDMWDSVTGITVDSLNGAGTVMHSSFGNAEPLNIGVANGSGTFSGNIIDNFNSSSGLPTLILCKSGTGTEVLSGNNTYSAGTYIGGSVLGGSYSGNTPVAGTFTPSGNGGKLLLLNTVGSALGSGTIDISSGTIQVGNGGATGGISATASIENDDTLLFNRSGLVGLSATLSGSGQLVQWGPGTLALSGSNNLTGPIKITAGAISLTGSGSVNSSSGINVNGPTAKFLQTSSVASTPAITLSQGTLDGTGTVGNVTVAAGAANTVAAGNGVSGTLTTGNLTFNGAGTVILPDGSVLNVSGALTSNPASTVTVDPSRVLWNPGTYKLIGYGSLPTADFASFAIGTVGGLSPREAAGALVNNTGSNEIDLTITGSATCWTGADGTSPTLWTTNTSVLNFALLSTGGSSSTYFLNGDTPVFDDRATGTSVAISGGVAPGSVTFGNNTKNFTVSSADGSGITGAASVWITGAGAVTINNSNGYTGGTTITNGLLNLGNASALGTGPLTITGGTIDNTSGGAIVIPNAQNWNSGFTFVGSNPLSMPSVTLNTTGTVLVKSSSLTVSGTVIGPGALTKDGSGTLVLGGNASYSGDTTLNNGKLVLNGNNNYGGNTVLNNGVLVLGSNAAIGNSALIINGGSLDCTVPGGGSLPNNQQTWNANFGFIGSQNLNFGTGFINLNNSVAVTLGGGTVTLGGAIDESSSNAGYSLTVNGPGTMVLNNRSIYTGGTIVNGATLNLNFTFWGQSTIGGPLEIDNGGAVNINSVGPYGAGLANITNVTLNGGLLNNVGGAGAGNVGGSTVTLNGGTMTTTGGGRMTFQGNVVTSNNPLLNGAITFDGGTLTGTNNITVGTSGNVLFGGNGQVFQVQMPVGSVINVLGGTLRNDYGNGDWSGNHASVYVAAGATLDMWDSAGGITVDALNGAGTVQHSSYGWVNEPLTIGIDNGSGTFSGTIKESGGGRTLSLVKTGTGTETLSGTGTYTGGTFDLVGGLTLTSSSAILTGSKLVVGDSAAFTAGPVIPAAAVAASPITGVPEPGTLALVAVGAAIAGAAAIRRRNRASSRSIGR